MGQEQAKQLLQQGIAAAKGGRSDIARQMLQQVVRLDPQNETAWLWLSSVMAEPKERMFCLKKLLEINPQNEFALKGLRALGVEPAQAAAPVPTTSVPTLDEAKYNRVMQAADEFLRRYNPQPPDRLDIRWTQKTKKRYNEGGTTHLRQIVYASAALVVLLLVGGIVLVFSQVNIFGSEGTPVGVVNTRIPSQTPLVLPTIEGPTATPFNDPMAVPATNVPSNLKQGNPYALMTPTDIYPKVDTNVSLDVKKGADLYSIGQYQEAVDELQQAREENDPYCYPSLVYYEALSLTALRDYQEALTLIDWARNYDSPNNDWTCQNKPLMLVALAQVWYAQDPVSDNALSFAEQALAEDADLVEASVIKARVLAARGQLLDARLTVAQALTNAPNDVNLLLVAADIELMNNQPSTALDYLGPALYMEPALPAALYLQAETYLRLAEQSQAGTAQQTEYYGLAVQSAQTIWLYYPGDPTGFLYLAKARIGEKNYALAETALTRIVEVQDTLPDNKLPVINEARRLRGDLLYNQGRLEEAQADYKWYADANPDSVSTDVLNRLVEIAMTTEKYSDALLRLDQIDSLGLSDATHTLIRARIEVEICTFNSTIACEYRDRLRDLTDSFINGLASDEQKANARSYRAQAQYQDTMNRSSLSDSERQQTLRRALNDVTAALGMRQTALDHYYRAMILDALNQPIQALAEYQWVDYWSQVYPYPFKDDDFDKRVEAVAEKAEELIAAQGTPEPIITPEPDTDTTATPRPTATRPANTPVRTPTPTPTPTQPTPAPIP